MKYLLILLLSGCSLLPTKFDSILYDHLVVLSIDAEQDQEYCGTYDYFDKIKSLSYKSKIALRYTENTSQDIHDSMLLVNKDINKLYNTKEPSKLYCQLTLKTINLELESLIVAIGGKAK